MNSIGKTFEIDPIRFPWFGSEDEPNVYPDDYPFAITPEEYQIFREKFMRESTIIESELMEFYKIDLNRIEVYSTKAQSLAKRYALHMCRYGLISYGDSIDVDTESEASVIETERWWAALEKVGKGDWSYLIGELNKKGAMNIRANRKIGYGIREKFAEDEDDATAFHEFSDILADAIADNIPGAFDMADHWFNVGQSLQNLAKILNKTFYENA
jgi:hypothetical protein